MATIADLIVNLTANVASFRRDISDASNSVTDLAAQVKESAKAIAEFLAFREVVNFAREASQATLEWSKSVEELSQRAGITTQEASALTASAREQGVEIGTLESFMARLSQRLATKPKEFSAMGIATRDASGQFLSMTQIASNVVGKLDEYKAGTDRTTAASALLGRSGAEFAGELERIHDALDKTNLAQAAELVRAFGLEVDQNGIAKAREWEKAEGTLSLAFLGVQNIIGQALLPNVEDLSQAITQMARSGELHEWATGVTADLGIMSGAVLDLIKLWEEFPQVVDTALIAIGTAVAVGSGGILAVVGGAIAAFGAIDKFRRDQALLPGKNDQATAGNRDNGWGDASDQQQGQGGGAPPAGTKSFIDPGPASKLNDEYGKLKAHLEETRNAQQLLNQAQAQGPVAIKAANTEIEIQKDLLELRNAKTGEGVSETSKMGQEVAELVRQTEQLKTANQVGVELTKLDTQIANQKELNAAQSQGAAAVRATNDAIMAHDEVVRLGISADSEWAKSIAAAVSENESLKRSYAAGTEIANLQRQISEQERLVVAYSQGTAAVREAQSALDAQNKLEQLGISATSDLGKQILALSQQEGALKTQVDQARQAFDENQQAVKTIVGDVTKFGDSIANAFTKGKQSSKSFKQQVLSDFQTLTQNIEQELMKLLVQQPLDNYFGGSQSGPSAGAGSGSSGGLFAALGSALGGLFHSAPKYDTGGIVGLGADEVPIIAHRGERILPANQAANGAGAGTTVHQQFFIQTPDADSFRASSSQILADARRRTLASARKS